MKPEKHRSRARGAAVSRGRMFLKAHLNWLPGFPLRQDQGVVVWMAMPQWHKQPPEQVTLDREHLHQATYIWNKLVYRFPRALPYLVADRKRWVMGVPQLLNWLKGAIHQGELLPVSLLEVSDGFSYQAVKQASQLVQAYPTFRPLLNAMSWLMYLNPQAMPQMLAWLQENGSAVQTILANCSQEKGILAVLNLWQLAQEDGRRRIVPLLHFLGDKRAYTVPTQAGVPYIEQWLVLARRFLKKRTHPTTLPQRPPPHFAAALLTFLEWLSLQDQTTRRYLLDLLALLWPDDVLASWEGWWQQVTPLLKRGRRLMAIRVTKRTQAEVQSLVEQLETCCDQHPPYLHITPLLDRLRELTAVQLTKEYRVLHLVLKRLPLIQEGILVRAAFLYHWLLASNQTPALWSEFHHFLSTYQHIPGLLKPWQYLVNAWNQPQPGWRWGVWSIILHTPSATYWPQIFAALANCCEAQETVDASDGELICRFVAVMGDAEVASRHFLALAKTPLREVYLPKYLWSCAYLLDKGRGHFVDLLTALQRVEDIEPETVQTITAAADQLEKAGWLGLAHDLILDGELKNFMVVGQRLAVLTALKCEIPILRPLSFQGALPAWGQHYPHQFGPALTTLIGVTSRAEHSAAQVLGKAFPHPQQLQQEIGAIEVRLQARPDDVKLARRLDNLRHRLTAPRTVSPGRLARLEAKLERAVRRAILQAWHERLDAVFREQLTIHLDLPHMPPWLFEPPQMRILGPLFQLSAAFRELGLRLLRQRCGPPPWNLIDDPANQAFLTRLRQLGIDPDPWIDPPEPRWQAGKNGRSVRLSFAQDPLEIFQMGYHFQTCLSPGAFNFFSVFANAADINKHVVYAHDAQQRVVGRCLLALTDNGGILTFEPYCHDSSLGFAHLIGQLAEELAARMGTFVLSQGNVPRLVAPDWYDDGPRDLCERFDFLQLHSPFRQSLKEIEVAAFVSALEEKFAPLPLNELTLNLVLSLSELDGRPELILPLLPMIRASKGFTDAAWLRIARLAYRAGEAGAAHQLLQGRAVPYLLRQFRQRQWLEPEIVKLLADLDPSAALRVLRQTRPRGVRRDEEEKDPTRRHLLAQAHDALGRSVRATRLRESIE